MEKQEPLYEKIEKLLEQRIKNNIYKIGEKLPTETELMKVFDVSRMTIRKALEILVDKQLIQRYPGRGSFISAPEISDEDTTVKKQIIIGVIFPKLSSAFGQQILSTLSSCADQRNINLLYTEIVDNSLETEQRAIQRMRQLADGIIIWPVPEKAISSAILKLIVDGYPIVLLDRYIKDLNTSYVVTDNKLAVNKALTYLTELGHTNICLVPKENTSDVSIQDRLSFAQHFLDSLSDIKVDLLWTKGVKVNKPASFSEHKQLLKENIQVLLKKNPRITAFFVTEYYPATILYNALEELGYKVPKDFSIICFDSPPFYHEKVVRFTHIKQNETKIGIDTFNILLENISNNSIIRKLENSDLIIGDTTAKPKKLIQTK